MALGITFVVLAFSVVMSGVAENAELLQRLSSTANEPAALGGQSAGTGGELADAVQALRDDAIFNTTPADELAGFTAEKVEDAVPTNSTHDGQLSRQVAECHGGMLVGDEEQCSLLDDPTDTRVRRSSRERASRHIIVDKSPSMKQVAEALQERLRDKFPDAESTDSLDSALHEKGSMGGKLLQAVSEAPRGSTVVLVSDFLDGETYSHVGSVRKIASDRQVTLALESVEHYPQPNIAKAAVATGGTVNVGSLGQKRCR